MLGHRARALPRRRGAAIASVRLPRGGVIVRLPLTMTEGVPMAIITPRSSRALIDYAKLPSATRSARAAIEDQPPLELKDREAQSLVAGSGLVIAAENVPAKTREDLVNCTLFAQLAASGEVPDSRKVMDWYDSYFRWLAVLGWSQSDRQFQDYRFSGRHAEAHKAVGKVLAALLGPQAAALVVVQAALEALQEMNENSPWLTLFDRQSRTEKSARFQVATAQVGDSGLIQTGLVGFSLKAKAELTQVLFFRFASGSTKLQYAAGQATIYEAALAEQREQISSRLKDYRRQLVGEVRLPPLPAARGLRTRLAVADARASEFKPGKALRDAFG
jgi:hypothetical protein